MVTNHFTATGIVFNSRHEVLMVKHKKLKVWLPPGGHVDENELPNEAALREIFEETGVKAEVISSPLSSQLDLRLNDRGCKVLPRSLVMLLEDIDGDGMHNHIDLIYVCKAISDEIILQTTEVYEVGWFSMAEFSQLKMFENTAKTVQMAYEFIKNN
jgi:ADP-ribose pyrophosphatase YjhB (NUDIX family)